MVGLSTIGNISFGCDFVAGKKRVPNPAAGISKKPLTHEEVQQSADRAAPKFQKLVTECICRMGQSLKK